MSCTLHTNLGDLKVELFCEVSPRAAENFLALCASGYYDGTSFHRNIKGFMVQVRAPRPRPRPRPRSRVDVVARPAAPLRPDAR
jgi:cyclophilin family peptidyl-prolyl cis-trans isomerase